MANEHVTPLRALVEEVLKRHGAPAEDARIIADVLIEAELRGRDTHGLARLKGLAGVYDRGSAGQPRIIMEQGPRVLWDGSGSCGYITAYRMAEHAADKARGEQIAVAAARHAQHCGMLGYYVSMMAAGGPAGEDNGVIGLAVANCWPLVAPWGGVQSVLGTNPIAAAFPAQPHPILIDLGTSATTQGAAARAGRRGEPLPPGCAVDRDGNPTRDPDMVREGALLPFGEHKGYALGLLVQLLCGPLTGAAAVPEQRTDYGLFMLAIRPDAFTEPDRYSEEVQALKRAVKSARRMKGFSEILLPGERAYRERDQRLRNGIEVPDDLLDEIKRL